MTRRVTQSLFASCRYRIFGSLSCVVIGWDRSKHRLTVRGPFKVRRMNRKLARLGLGRYA